MMSTVKLIIAISGFFVNIRNDAIVKGDVAKVSNAAMNSALKAISEGGAKEIEFDPLPAYNGFHKYQDAGWKLKATGREAPEKEDKKDSPGPNNYPKGIGMALLNGCFLTKYEKSSPCFNSVATSTKCLQQQEGANFIGVGFNGRGRYSSDSRKLSLIQRRCEAKRRYKNKQVPDIMTAFGIYDYSVTMNVYSSTQAYVEHLQKQSATSKTSSMYKEESESHETKAEAELNLGVVNVEGGGGKGEKDTKQHGTSSKNSNGQSSGQGQQKRSATMMAVLEANLKLFEIALDVVTPNDLSMPFLKDFLALPVEWQSIGAMDKFQSFILRYGTHYITSAKFGGQLKIVKTRSASSGSSESEFSKQASEEFGEMMGSSHEESTSGHAKVGVNIAGVGGSVGVEHTETEGTAEKETNSEAKSSGENQGSGNSNSASSDKTSLEVKGGDPQIAKAVMDFYSPTFRGDFVEWLESIPDSPKPYEFTMKKVSALLDIRADLFPKNKSICGNTNKLVQAVPLKKAEKCDDNSKSKFENDFEERRLSLQRAEVIYMAEGPFDTSSFEIRGGLIGCETNYLDYEMSEKELEETPHSWPTWNQIRRDNEAFEVMLALPINLDYFSQEDVFEMRLSGSKTQKMWMYKYLGSSYSMKHTCPLTDTNKHLICIADLIMLYDEETGILKYQNKAVMNSNQKKYFYEGMPIGTVGLSKGSSFKINTRDHYYQLPCSVEWTNNHRIDPYKKTNCIHFTASTSGSIYLVFAEIPGDKETWYYIHITSKGVAFYQRMKLVRQDLERGVGSLGDKSLYESFFVCVTQSQNDLVQILYGKTSGKKDEGHAKSAFTFPDSKNERLTFFSFGTGHQLLKIDSVRIVTEFPVLKCPPDYEKKDGSCKLVCDKECKLCHKPNDATACIGCKHAEDIGEDGEERCITECPDGKTDLKNNTICEKCGRGEYGREGKCYKCSAGSYQNKRGQTDCDQCPEGSYSNTDGSARCTPCKIDYHQDSRGETSCKKCVGTGAQFRGRGAVNCDNRCMPGKFFNGITCVTADKGHMVDKPTMKKQTKCPIGTYQDEMGKDSCKVCSAGSFSRRKGAEKCSLCPKDKYQDKPGQAECKKCLYGKTALREGTTECYDQCSEGFAHDSVDPSICNPCPTGTYAESDGMIECTPCKPGKHQPRIGQSQCNEEADFTLENRKEEKVNINGTLLVRTKKIWGTVCAPMKKVSKQNSTVDIAMVDAIATIYCSMRGYTRGKGESIPRKDSKRYPVWNKVTCDAEKTNFRQCESNLCYPLCNCKDIIYIGMCSK